MAISNTTLVQAGAAFYGMASDGSFTAMTAPTTATVSATNKPRFTVDGAFAVVVNSVAPPLIADDSGILLFLSPAAPTVAPTVAATVSGTLTGTYFVKYTFIILDTNSTLIAESDFSPVSASVSPSSKKISVSALQLMSGLGTSIDPRYTVQRRLYRTTNGTTTYFKWLDVADNTTTTAVDDASDASLATFSAPTLGSIASLSHVANFGGRLFGVAIGTARDVLRYTETAARWAWPAANIFTMPQVPGDPQAGITALMPRRDALGIAKANMFIELRGVSDANFSTVILSSTVGTLNQETVASFRDMVYFLSRDGVYSWSDAGLTNLAEGKVKAWFTTDTYFNRDLFSSAFAYIDINTGRYYLFLVSAGSTTVDRWVEYNIENNTWWGPHITAAYTPTSAFAIAAPTPTFAIGETVGFVTKESATRNDNTTSPIASDVITVPMTSESPPQTQYWGELYTEVTPQATGNLGIEVKVGEPADVYASKRYHPLKDGVFNTGRMGVGRWAQFRFTHNGLNEVLELIGFEINPVNKIGRR